MATIALSARQSERVALHRLWWVGPLTISAAVVANVVVRAVAGMAVAIPPAFAPLHYEHIALVTAAGVLGAVLTFAGIGRVTQRPLRLFRIVAATVFLLSFVPDIGLLMSRAMPGANGLTVGVLMVLHVAPALVSVAILTTLGRDT